VKVILLNNGQQLPGIADISQGGLTGSVIDVRLIAQYAITANASAALLAHNHPSGTLKPSHSDIEITKKVKDAMKLLDITLLDHLIINKDGQYITTNL